MCVGGEGSLVQSLSGEMGMGNGGGVRGGSCWSKLTGGREWRVVIGRLRLCWKMSWCSG